MATRRLFLLRPPPTLHPDRFHHLSSSPFRLAVGNFSSLHQKKRRSAATATIKPTAAVNTTAAVKDTNNKKSKKKDYLSDEHLKRRTRSSTVFDRHLYSRYSSGGHVPVLLGEVLDAFRLPKVRSFVDCTLGAAGHSSALIEAHPELELYLGLDIDPVAHDKAKVRIETLLRDKSLEGLKAFTHVRNFKYIKSVLGAVDEGLLERGVDGILMDLGMSSMQVNHSERGFSVLGDGPLDMRMNPQASLKAEDILNSWPETEVGRILHDYGEESNWHFLQRKITHARLNGGLHTTGELVDLIRSTSAKSGGRQGWMKTATRVFQALRIAVNDELQTLEDALYACFDCLSPGGRLAVISFHSLEDRIVKQTFLDIIEKDEGNEHGGNHTSHQDKICDEGEMSNKQKVQGKNGIVLTKRPITPSEEEERLNRRCRSAKLRVIQKAVMTTT